MSFFSQLSIIKLKLMSSISLHLTEHINECQNIVSQLFIYFLKNFMKYLYRYAISIFWNTYNESN